MRLLLQAILGGILRFVVGYGLANWALIVSAVSAVGAFLWAFFSKWGYLPAALAALAAAVLMMWLVIGFVWLKQFGAPLVVKPVEDFSYALGYMGLSMGFDPGNPSALQIGVRFVNYGPRAVKYEVENIRVIVDDRTIAAPIFTNKGGVVPRGVSRTYYYPSFTADQIKDYLGKRPTGTIEFTILYGPYDGKYVRQLNMTIGTTYNLGDNPGIVDVIMKEDETDNAN
jgi:hypothetical protein